MPRPLRIEYENAWYHVMNRGANRQLIYKTNADRNLFCKILSEVVDQFQIEIHAFCLMSNHYHLLIKTPYPNLSDAMRHLNGIYTQCFNRVSERDGPLFRGRYKSILVESNEYLLNVSRYIHLNPVSANICTNPGSFKWSSYRAYINENLTFPWLHTSFILNYMSDYNLRQSYSLFVKQGIDDETAHFYSKKQQSSILGSKSFVEAKLNNINTMHRTSVLSDINRTKPLPGSEAILKCVMEHFNIPRDNLIKSIQGSSNDAKRIAIYLLRQLGQIKHKQICDIFDNLKTSSISSEIIRSKKLLKISTSFQNYVSEISRKIQDLPHDGT